MELCLKRVKRAEIKWIVSVMETVKYVMKMNQNGRTMCHQWSWKHLNFKQKTLTWPVTTRSLLLFFFFKYIVTTTPKSVWVCDCRHLESPASVERKRKVAKNCSERGRAEERWFPFSWSLFMNFLYQSLYCTKIWYMIYAILLLNGTHFVQI